MDSIPTAVQSGMQRLRQTWPWLNEEFMGDALLRLSGRDPQTHLCFCISVSMPGLGLVKEPVLTWELSTLRLKWERPPPPSEMANHDALFRVVPTNGHLEYKEKTEGQSVVQVLAQALAMTEEIRDGLGNIWNFFDVYEESKQETVFLPHMGSQCWGMAFEWADSIPMVICVQRPTVPEAEQLLFKWILEQNAQRDQEERIERALREQGKPIPPYKLKYTPLPQQPWYPGEIPEATIQAWSASDYEDWLKAFAGATQWTLHHFDSMSILAPIQYKGFKPMEFFMDAFKKHLEKYSSKASENLPSDDEVEEMDVATYARRHMDDADAHRAIERARLRPKVSQLPGYLFDGSRLEEMNLEEEEVPMVEEVPMEGVEMDDDDDDGADFYTMRAVNQTEDEEAIDFDPYAGLDRRAPFDDVD